MPLNGVTIHPTLDATALDALDVDDWLLCLDSSNGNAPTIVRGTGGGNVLTVLNNGEVLMVDTLAGASVNSYDGGDSAIFPSATHLEVTDSGANSDITGLEATGLLVKDKVLMNVGANDIVLKHDDAGSPAADRFNIGGAVDLTLNPGDSATVRYVTSESRWRII
jgi:hypothetical protein